jgi:outer membrane protein assembly factor BamB
MPEATLGGETPGSTLLKHGDRLFTGGGGEARCYDATDGRLLWEETFAGEGLGWTSLAAPGVVANADRF